MAEIAGGIGVDIDTGGGLCFFHGLGFRAGSLSPATVGAATMLRMKIAKLQTFILHVPVTRNSIADSTHSITHWGVVGTIIETDSGIRGYGYTGTHAHLPTDRLIAECIEHTFGPLIIGADPLETRHLWQKLATYSPAQWVGRMGITHLAVGAIDIALWDIKAKQAQTASVETAGRFGFKTHRRIQHRRRMAELGDVGPGR